MDCPGEALDEAAVVYMADKLTAGSQDRVTLRERFEKSEKKCLTPGEGRPMRRGVFRRTASQKK
jgi:hypothetical protein